MPAKTLPSCAPPEKQSRSSLPRVSEQVLVPFKPGEMFELVRDIESYPNFIKWIETLTVSNKQSEDARLFCVADVKVQFKGFSESFSTIVQSDEATRRIVVDLKRGPFRHLKNRWQFDAREDTHTRVHFFMDYEFSNPVLGLLARTNDRLAVSKIMSAFKREAARRYGADRVQEI